MSPLDPGGDERLLRAFRRAAADLPWYRTLLAEHGVDPARIVDVRSFSTGCPLLTKRNTFDRFPIDQLAAVTDLAGLAAVLTSSGHGGRFSFGLNPRSQAAEGGAAIDQAFDAAFQTSSRTTLAINCLPMGVGFPSGQMTVATTSVREDMAVALVQAFGAHYDQILLVADPLFMKRLIDHAAASGVDWTRHRVQVLLGEEIFGERFREYVARSLGLDLDRPERGYIASSFGVGELGLHVCFETAATIALRRAAARDPALAGELLGVERGSGTLPMILTFDPQRTFVEVASPDAAGYGRLTISMLDDELPIPLLRYQTGDIARLLDARAVADTLRRRGAAIPSDLPGCLIALQGRAGEALPNGSHVGAYKDALYADPLVARHVTGAFRVAFAGAACTLHVQLARPGASGDALERRLRDAIPPEIRPARILFWPRHRFPFGTTLDYERKFQYYVDGT
jgi:phenylacetate-CoA ligase